VEAKTKESDIGGHIPLGDHIREWGVRRPTIWGGAWLLKGGALVGGLVGGLEEISPRKYQAA